MLGDRVEVLVDVGDGVRSFDITATKAGRRVEVSTSRGTVEVAEVTRTGDVGVCSQGGDGAAHVRRRLGDGEVRINLGPVPPVLLADAVRLEHHLRPQPSRRDDDRSRPLRPKLTTEREAQAQYGPLGQVV